MGQDENKGVYHVIKQNKKHIEPSLKRGLNSGYGVKHQESIHRIKHDVYLNYLIQE